MNLESDNWPENRPKNRHTHTPALLTLRRVLCNGGQGIGG